MEDNQRGRSPSPPLRMRLARGVRLKFSYSLLLYNLFFDNLFYSLLFSYYATASLKNRQKSSASDNTILVTEMPAAGFTYELKSPSGAGSHCSCNASTTSR